MTLVKNTLFSLLPTVAGVVVSIATVPFYISVFGTERYGALLIAFVLLGYFGQVDFGLGRAITQRLSSMPNASAQERASVVWSALGGASVVAAVGAALVYLAANVFFGSFFEADAGLRAEVLESTWLFALCVPVIMFTGVSSGALLGLERFGIVSAGTTIGNLSFQILPVLVGMFHSVEISWLLGASLVGRIIGLLPIMVSMWFVFLRAQPINPSTSQLRRLFSFGAWIMLTAIVGPLMTMSDRVVIGAAISAAAVVAYSVPFQIASRTVMFPMAIVQALFPRLASQESDDAALLGKDAVVVIGQTYAFVVTGLICLAEPLLRLWLGDGFDQRSVMVGQIALIGFWANAIANVPYSLIQARGNPRFTAVLHVIELPVYFAMLYGFGTTLGLYGIALAFSLRAMLDCVILFRKAELWDRKVAVRLVGPAIVILSAFFMSRWTQDWTLAIAVASLCTAVLLVMIWFQMPAQVRLKLTALMGH